MATEYQARTFDTGSGAIFLFVQDAIFGNRSAHTIYVAGANGVADVEAEIARILAEADDHAQVIHDRMVAAGWKANGN
jgi:hypothetical protein